MCPYLLRCYIYSWVEVSIAVSAFLPSHPTSPGRRGASHMCWPSSESHEPSTSLSGVLTSPFTPGSTFTLSGKAAMSGEDVTD